MSVDRYYLCNTLDPKTWTRFTAGEFLPEPFGNFVVNVTADKNSPFDELYCFANEKDAWEFFENVQRRIVEYHFKGEFVACRGDLNEKQLADVKEWMANSAYVGYINGEPFKRPAQTASATASATAAPAQADAPAGEIIDSEIPF